VIRQTRPLGMPLSPKAEDEWTNTLVCGRSQARTAKLVSPGRPNKAIFVGGFVVEAGVPLLVIRYWAVPATLGSSSLSAVFVPRPAQPGVQSTQALQLMEWAPGTLPGKETI
jgi:hypothetical protein